MIPGITSKLSETTVASATTITAKSDIVIVTGATTIQTINPNFGGGFSGFLVLIPTTGLTLGTTGNILVGIAAAVNRAVYLTYSRSLAKWVINSGV
jgi:orotidine-5'-phosphate decarboxylase